ncbi:MAG TPA: PIG-L family deacetylase [Bryobacteraceae bacterium]|nr:PIG-L family deacetylase [Bryobacteraceae bacterium]
MIRRGCAWLVILITACLAQRPFSGTPEIRHAIERLANTGSVLMIAAHPDDENTTLLAYLARGRKVRTGYLSLTRGEGGQNLLGPEKGVLLGLIRTQELLASRRIDGAEQFFTNAVDFGYTKSPDEALQVWGRDKILGEIVSLVRAFRPDVIVLQFSGTARDGHGQHQASAILGREAFTAAADRTRYPEQLRSLEPWRARRLVWNVYGDTDQPHLTLDAGEFDPVFGYSYAEIAALGRSMHRSQAFGTAQPRGPVPVRIINVAGEAARTDILDGIDLTWNRVSGGAAVANALSRVLRDFDPERPEATVPALIEARRQIERISDRGLRDRKLREAADAIAIAAGVWFDATASRPEAAPGAEVSAVLTAISRSSLPVTLKSVQFGARESSGGPLAKNVPFTKKTVWRVAKGEKSPAAAFTVEFAGATLTFERPLIYRWVDERLGERTRSFMVVPPVSVAIAEPAVVFPDARPRRIAVQLRAQTAAVAGSVRLQADSGWRISPAARAFAIPESGLQQTVYFEIAPPQKTAAADVRARAAVGGDEVAITTRNIDYPHIEPQTVFETATSRFVRADVKVLAREIGYVMGGGDEIPHALRQIGCRVTLLAEDDLEHGDLSRFDAIVTGPRAWNEREDLRANRSRLFEYARNGGTLVVQYNVLRPPPGEFSPFPIKISHDRVSREDAPVRIVDSRSPLLHRPNEITDADFSSWVQERGLYFGSEWDPRLRPVIASADPGEKPHAGGLLWARYGKGLYIFTAYSWFRQLPAGVPGAYRIVANLISAGRE